MPGTYGAGAQMLLFWWSIAIIGDPPGAAKNRHGGGAQ